ncbi:conserved hypothetical protein [Agrobacterium fabacearum TT111]|nr:conserved hypothetical protein [Agrobacterium fabacearum TT111]
MWTRAWRRRGRRRRRGSLALSLPRGTPSVLPDISPTRVEIELWLALDNLNVAAISDVGSPCRYPPLWGRCPAGQRGVSLHTLQSQNQKNPGCRHPGFSL